MKRGFKKTGKTKRLRRESVHATARHQRLFPTAVELAHDIAEIAMACSGEVAASTKHPWPASMPPCAKCGFPGHAAKDCVA